MRKESLLDSQRTTETDVLAKTGFWSAVLLTILALGTFLAGFLTPPISGPFCTGAGAAYPYSQIVSRFPRDYYWMIPAMLLLTVFVVFMACVNQNKPILFGRIALIFASLSAGILIVAYFIQISVIQPSMLAGEQDGIALLTQYNPHGLFIAAEEIGYLLLCVSLLFMAPVFSGRDRIQKAIRATVIVGFVLTALSFAGIAIGFGVHREYRFEVAVITICYFEMISVGCLTAVLFGRSLFAGK